MLSVKDNHPCLKKGIADYAGDAALRRTMDTASQTEKNRDRIEKRSAYITGETGWLTAAELLHHARMEWTVEAMHWLLEVHFGEDICRVEDRNIQQNLNMLRKAAINLIKRYKQRAESKRSMSKRIFDCLLNPYFISDILEN